MANRWRVLALLCLARMLMGLHLQTVAAIAPFLIADLGLSYAELGLLIGVFMLPGAFLALPGGLVSARLGDKVTLLAGLGLLTLGTGLLAVSSGFGLALLARLLAGAGGTLLTMQVAKVLTDWFAGREIATAIGIMLGTFPVGVALAMAGLGGLAAVTSWQLAALVAAATAALVLVLVAVLFRDLPRDEVAGGVVRPPIWAIAPAELRLAVVAGVAFSVANAAFVVFTSFTPPVLIERGRSEVEAGVLVSWSSWTSVAALPAAGYVLDRVGRATGWLLLATVLTAGACFALPLGEPAWLWIVLYGIAVAPVVLGVMALPSEVLPTGSRATGFGVFYTMNYIGFSLLPVVAGYLLDATRSTAAPVWFGGLLFLSIAPLLLLFRWLQRRATSSAEPVARHHDPSVSEDRR